MGLSFNQARMLLLTASKQAWSKPSQNLKDEKASEQEKPTNLPQNTESKDTATIESTSIKNLPTDTLLANKGINITTENKIEQPFQGFSDDIEEPSKEFEEYQKTQENMEQMKEKLELKINDIETNQKAIENQYVFFKTWTPLGNGFAIFNDKNTP